MPPTPAAPPQRILQRATANATWWPLRRALTDGWPLLTDWTNHDPRGNPHTSDYNPASIPGPLPTYTPTNETHRIVGRLEPHDWPSNGYSLAARLNQTDYEMIAAQLDHQQRTEWITATTHSTARTPFLLDKNRHGTPVLRRNHDPGALITPLVAEILTTLATLTDVRLLTKQDEARIYAALLDEPDDHMRANELFAIAQKSGITEP